MKSALSNFGTTTIDNYTGKTLFLLHGTGGTERDFLFLDEVLHKQFTLVGLRGNVDENGMSRFFKRHSEGVFDQKSIREESGKLGQFISEWMNKYSVNPKDTVLLGYSNGANILLSTLFLYPDNLQTLILLHPMLPLDPPNGLDLSGKKVFVSYGINDTMIAPGASKNVATVLVKHGATVALRNYPGGHGLSRQEIDDAVEFIKNC